MTVLHHEGGGKWVRLQISLVSSPKRIVCSERNCALTLLQHEASEIRNIFYYNFQKHLSFNYSPLMKIVQIRECVF